MERKRILILGGASVHCKLVQAAKEMGLYTVVTDYLSSAPGKDMADESRMVNITDIDGVVDFCRSNGIDAVLSTHLDPCQRPYQQICQRLGVPCYGTQDQFMRMTDKHIFKKMCQTYGVDVIPEYSMEDVLSDRVDYPVFVKPVDSRGSRGQSVCRNKDEVVAAVAVAQSESTNGDVLIEKYMGEADEVQITYFFVDGQPYLIRTVDSHRGSAENHLDKVVACSISPSQHTEEYLHTAHERVVNMFKSIGFCNGPIFMQGFYDGGKFRFFDPGLRFPGVDYDKIYVREYGIDIMKMMVAFALQGHFDQTSLPQDMYDLNGKKAAVLFPVISAGKIAAVSGLKQILEDPRVFSYSQRHDVGETVEWTYNVNQRFAEINVIGQNEDDLRDVIDMIYSRLKVFDEHGRNMLFEIFDTRRI